LSVCLSVCLFVCLFAMLLVCLHSSLYMRAHGSDRKPTAHLRTPPRYFATDPQHGHHSKRRTPASTRQCFPVRLFRLCPGGQRDSDKVCLPEEPHVQESIVACLPEFAALNGGHAGGQSRSSGVGCAGGPWASCPIRVHACITRNANKQAT
jgi:hypothetical protein